MWAEHTEPGRIARKVHRMPEASSIQLTTPLAMVPGIPPGLAEAMALMGLTNVGRLVAHLPMRHEVQEPESTIDQAVPGRIIATRGEVTAVRTSRGRRPRVEAVLTDGTGRLEVLWFNMLFMREKVHPGVRLWVQGKAARKGNAIQLVNPRSMVLRPESEEPALREAQVRPIYPASENAKSWQIERAIRRVLPEALAQIHDHLPAAYREPRGLPPLADAYRMYHDPRSTDDVLSARRRLAYDELLLLQLGVHMKRHHLRQSLRAPALRADEEVDRAIRARFPFALTPAQDVVVGEITRDLASSTPANRLIQGDVGCGKTAVAVYAMLLAVASGAQAALMAPTEILAEQHATNLAKLLKGSQVRSAVLTGSATPADREAVLAGLADGSIDLVVGTHALLTDDVRFSNLALAVIDEQHRFGVHQRARLRAKASEPGVTPHVLVMTATPIPRTLAITLFGDLDISIIDALPPGRSAVRTRVVSRDQRAEVYADVASRIEAGEQAYIVVPTIGDEDAGEPDDGELASVRWVHRELEAGPLKGKRLAVLHGRLRPTTRDATMERFRAGVIDALITTTVIEVGVDVANATTIVIEHADRFGLAQLHQLRGRVGRGTRPGRCVLVADPEAPEAMQRLAVMESTHDGFALAEEDLAIRGPGELFGTRQSGLPPLKVADLMKDRDLLGMARRDAAEWIAASPTLARPHEELVRRRLLKAYGDSLGLGDVG